MLTSLTTSHPHGHVVDKFQQHVEPPTSHPHHPHDRKHNGSPHQQPFKQHQQHTSGDHVAAAAVTVRIQVHDDNAAIVRGDGDKVRGLQQQQQQQQDGRKNRTAKGLVREEQEDEGLDDDVFERC
jgi:hypothetical protein